MVTAMAAISAYDSDQGLFFLKNNGNYTVTIRLQ